MIKEGIIFNQSANGPEEIEVSDKELQNLDLGKNDSDVVDDNAIEVDEDFQIIKNDDVEKEYKKELGEDEDTSKDDELSDDNEEDDLADTSDEDVDEETTDEVLEDEDSEEEDNVLSAFAKELASNGIIQGIDEKDLEGVSNFEDLASIIQTQMEHTVTSWQSEYKEDLINNLVKEGIIKKEQVEDFLPVDYSKEDIIGNEEAARTVVTNYYKEKGFSDKRIKKLIENSLDLEEDALDVYDELQEIKEQKQKEVAKKIEEEKKAYQEMVQNRFNSWRETLDKTKEFIPGRAIDKSFRDKTFKNIIPTFEKINNDLTKYGPILSLLDQYGILEGNFDNVIKTVKSKSTKNQFEKILKSSSKKKYRTREEDEIQRIALESLKKRRK